MKSENVELKLIKKLLTKINFSQIDALNINLNENEILGLYIYGSRLWGTADEQSDLDYCVIVYDNSPIIAYQNYIQKESEDVDLHIMSESYYKDLVQNCDDMALSMYFQEYPLIKYDYLTDINLVNLRKSFSSKANNSYVKAKKKLADGEIRIAYKSLYHSIRILSFGRKIADATLNNEKIYDMTSFGENIEWFKQCFEVEKMPWEEIHKIFKPIYNSYATEFKKLAPKA